MDSNMKKLANAGNGNYAYLDSLLEAKKVMLTEFGSSFFTVAKDVKIQVEFNPEHVAAYRLIGYENRLLAAKDFNDDKKDAGEIGSGYSMTAFYEIIPAGGKVPGGEGSESQVSKAQGYWQQRNVYGKDALEESRWRQELQERNRLFRRCDNKTKGE